GTVGLARARHAGEHEKDESSNHREDTNEWRHRILHMPVARLRTSKVGGCKSTRKVRESSRGGGRGQVAPILHRHVDGQRPQGRGLLPQVLDVAYPHPLSAQLEDALWPH